MQQRRLRLGDILDDYCPRERRITNHAIVAMIDDQVKQTRCTTCDADHEYKQARVPPPRRKKDSAVADESSDDPSLMDEELIEEVASEEQPAEPLEEAAAEESEPGDDEQSVPDDDGPVHRRLIRATLPRPEGQSPERKTPEFTVRQPGGRGREFDGNRGAGAGGAGGQRPPGRGRRTARGPQGSFSGGPSRFGGPRQNGPGDQRQNGGNRPGPSGGQRSGGRPPGQSRGPGRKRGR